MGADVNMLLALARRQTAGPHSGKSIDMADLIESVIKDLSASHNEKYRVALTGQAPLIVFSDATMVRMLLRHLIPNDLHHTKRQNNKHIPAHSTKLPYTSGRR